MMEIILTCDRLFAFEEFFTHVFFARLLSCTFKQDAMQNAKSASVGNKNR